MKEQAKYMDLMEQSRMLEQEEEAANGADLTVKHIVSSKLLSNQITKPANPYRKVINTERYQKTMEDAILRNEYLLQQAVEEKHKEFETYKMDLEFELSEKERIKKYKELVKQQIHQDLCR